MLKVKESGSNSSIRDEAIKTYDEEMIGRGAKAVTQSLKEAENSIDLETVGRMLMLKQGHGRSA